MKRKTKFRGVSWHKLQEAWEVRVRYDGRQYQICYSEDDVTAALVRDYVVSLLYGEKAKLNLPGESMPEAINPFLIRNRLHHHGIEV